MSRLAAPLLSLIAACPCGQFLAGKYLTHLPQPRGGPRADTASSQGTLRLQPATAPAEALRTDRLARLCVLWGTVRYLHPALAYKDIDWDAALVEALPRVAEAKSAEDYAAAVRQMLDRLGDPATSVVRDVPARPAPKSDPTGKGRPLFTWHSPDVLAVHLDDPDVRLVQAVAAAAPCEQLRGLGSACCCRRSCRNRRWHHVPWLPAYETRPTPIW